MNFTLDDYPFLNKCSGIDAQGAALSREMKAKVESIYEVCIEVFTEMVRRTPGTKNDVNHRLRYYLGTRCNLDGVMKRLMGREYQMEWSANLLSWVLDALRDCASADYYYSFEKEY